jgi:hypothetical protein
MSGTSGSQGGIDTRPQIDRVHDAIKSFEKAGEQVTTLTKQLKWLTVFMAAGTVATVLIGLLQLQAASESNDHSERPSHSRHQAHR